MNHPIDPVYDSHSIILILGTFPSVKSRETGFYYGHPQNRFWKVISAVCRTALPTTQEAKTSLLLSHHIALWDVLCSCEIKGSSDASITNAQPNDLSKVLGKSKIELIIANGNKAAQYLHTFHPDLKTKVVTLPSTSAANAAMTLDDLTQRWLEILQPILDRDHRSI